jgi:hypothetical protein
MIRRKLEAGSVPDPLEHEADRVADQVMHVPDAGLPVTAAPQQVRRKCPACEEKAREPRFATFRASACIQMPGSSSRPFQSEHPVTQRARASLCTGG